MSDVTFQTVDKQAIFDHVVTGLFEQGGPSIGKMIDSERTICLYRSEGRKCAGGHLIPDSLYTPEIEGRTIDFVLKDFDLESNHLALFRALQVAHDTCSDTTPGRKSWADMPKSLGKKLLEVAEEFHLNTNVLSIYYTP